MNPQNQPAQQPVQPAQPNYQLTQVQAKKPIVWQALVAVLAAALIITIVLWMPWQPSAKALDRVISVTGDATVTAKPDEFTFSPGYSFTDPSKDVALAAATKKSNEVIAKLKALGVVDADIKSSASGYQNGTYYPVESAGAFTYSLSLTIVTHTPELTQKVQDYLVSTGPTGTVSPSSNFSKKLTKTLQDKARIQAELDARSKADQSAKNLGFKVTGVKSVVDGSLGGRTFYPSSAVDAVKASPDQLTVQPGENDLPYSVSVVYYIH